jgi:peptidoglycan hydrolase-like protein with peptidoglycan-binding domain
MTSPLRRTLRLTVTASLTSVLALAPFATAAGAQTDPSSTTTAPPTTTTTAPPAPTVLHHLPLSGGTLAEGAKGSEVFLLQITLTARGFWLQDFPGNFGASTRHALVAFQKYGGLPRSGQLDPLTRFVLGATLDRAQPKVPKLGRSIEVDIARQILTISDNGQVLWVFDISTGKKSTPTPRGSYTLTRQINDQRISKLGELWRPKYFTGGYALHGSPSVPNYPASHGCVRMTNQEINFLWDSNIAPIGTPVTLF